MKDPQWELVKMLLKSDEIWKSATLETLQSITKGSLECIIMMAEKMQELEDRVTGIEAFLHAQELERIPKKEKKRDQPEAR